MNRKEAQMLLDNIEAIKAFARGEPVEWYSSLRNKWYQASEPIFTKNQYRPHVPQYRPITIVAACMMMRDEVEVRSMNGMVYKINLIGRNAVQLTSIGNEPVWKTLEDLMEFTFTSNGAKVAELVSS